MTRRTSQDSDVRRTDASRADATRDDPRRTEGGRNDPVALQGGVPSPPHRGLRRPVEPVPREALRQVDLSDLGASAEDRLRDRRNNGTPDRR
jgi:hypothetical protein